MADRSVKVQLSAQVQSYVDGMEKAARATRETGSEAEKLAQHQQAFEMLGRSAMVMGAVAAAGVTLAISKWADFDQAMSNVQAATHESEASMEMLSNAALDAGARTVFSAEESANAIEELAKAGVSTADILNGALDGALDLAAAGGLGVADAAGIAATALKTFKLEGSDMAHVADLLAAGAGKAMGDVTDLSAALNQSAMVANATGLSIEETTAGLAAFASQGLIGSDAGTSFKSMLQALTPTSGAAADKMKELGISAYDQQGKFVGLAEFAGQLKTSLSDLTVEQQQAALKTIFGSDAIRAATVLYSEGEEGIRDWTQAVDDQGYAAETAAARLDNLKGDMEALGGAFDTALIKTGSASNDVLRTMIQTVTDMIDGYNNLPAPLQSVTLALGATTAAVGLLGGGFMLGVPKYAAYKDALATLGPVAQRANSALMGIGKGLAVIGGAMVAANVLDSIANSGTDAALGLEELEKSVRSDGLDAAFTGLTDDSNDLSAALQLLLGSSFNSGMERFGSGLNKALGGSLSDNVKNTEDRFRSLGEYLASMTTEGKASEAADLFDEVAAAAKKQGIEVDEVKNLMPAYTEALAGAANANDEVAITAEDAGGNLDEMKAALDGVAGSSLVMSEAQDAALSSINSLVEATEAENASLYGADDASIALRNSMRDVETSHRDSATAILENKGSMDEAMASWQAGRDKVIEMRVAMGESREAAVVWADQNLGSAADVSLAMSGVATAVNNIPAGKNINITTSGDALAKIKEINNWLAVTPEYKHISISGTGGISGLADGGIFEDYVKAFANSGFEPGIYDYRPGGIHKFAEEYGEAYISMDPARKQRSVGVWQEAGRRLGVDQATSGTQGGGVTNVTQNNVINQIERDPRLIQRQLGRELKGLL